MVSVLAALGAHRLVVVRVVPRRGPGGAGRLVVATTVAPITSITAAVVGDLAEVRGIVPEGTNSHTFEPPPSAAEILAEADVVFLNGLQLEEPTKELAEANLARRRRDRRAGQRDHPRGRVPVRLLVPRGGGQAQPAPLDQPADGVTLRRDHPGPDDRARSRPTPTPTGPTPRCFAAKVDELDAAMRAAFATVPAEQRKLLTYHDAYAYFAEDYGWEVIGAIQVSDFEDPTAGRWPTSSTRCGPRSVPAIFGSEVFPSPVLEQIGNGDRRALRRRAARRRPARTSPAIAEHSLLGLLRFDYVTMTEALGGDPPRSRRSTSRSPRRTRADYPQ